MTINEKQEEIISQFSGIEDWMDKYEKIVELGRQLPEMDEYLKTDENLIRGCQAQVWLVSELVDGNVIFNADSDTLITKGMIALIIEVLNNRPSSEILKTELYFLDKIGLKEHLSPMRSNGLLSMVKQVKLLALSTR